MYYVEYVERNPGIDEDEFRSVIRESSLAWAREHQEDELCLMIGRTWRLGPKPEYMVIYRISNFARIDEWTSEFARKERRERHGRFREVATIIDAGVFEDIGQEVL